MVSLMTNSEPAVVAYGVAEAKAHLSEILRKVEAGQSVTITRRGQAVATIVPARQGAAGALDWASIEAFRRTLPGSRTSAAQLVREMRDAGF
jgi:prevent-host-death family protein